MTNDASLKVIPDGFEIENVWSLLSPEERLNYWEFAGDEARNLDHKASRDHKPSTFLNLCVAVRNAGSDKSVNRQIKHLPVVGRPLSADELRRSIRRLKEELLDQPLAKPFLTGALCKWVQNEHLTALLAVLDVVHCPRNELGDLKGAIPDFPPDAVNVSICQLASGHVAREMALACGALMLNNIGWRGLRKAFDALNNLDGIGNSESLPRAVSEETGVGVAVADSADPTHSALDSGFLLALRQGIAGLREHLTAAVTEISDDRVPNPDAAIDCWRQVQEQYSQLAKSLGVTSTFVADLEAAVALRESTASAVSDLSRCRSIAHLTDPQFVGCEIIAERCDAFQKDLSTGELAQPRLVAVSALLCLIDKGDTLNDEAASRLQVQVEEVFGKKVATAALRRNLVVRPGSPPDRMPTPVGKQEVGQRIGTPPSLELEELHKAPSSETNSGTTQSSLDMLAAEITDSGAAAQNQTAATEKIHQAPIAPESPASALALENDAQSSPIQYAVEPSPCEPDPSHEATDPSVVENQNNLAAEVESFRDFKKTHWVDSTGATVKAPWSDERFAAQLTRNAVEAWEVGEAAIAYLFSRAICALGASGPFGVDDLASADQILSEPSSHSAGVDASRALRLRKQLENSSDVEPQCIGLALMLEALRPTLPCSFTPSEVEGLVERASYNDSSLSEMVRFLLNGWSAQLDPLPPLRVRLLDAPKDSREVVEAALHLAQDVLTKEVATLWSAAGGKLQRTHCRVAWAKFVQEEVVPLRDELAPKDPVARARVKLRPNQIGVRVNQFGRSFQRIMDAADVRRQDRSAAEGAARQIVEAISRVTDALQRLDALRQHALASHQGLPYEAGLRLLSESSPSTTDQLCASIFTATLKGKSQVNMLRLKAGYLINHADVIMYLNPQALQRRGIAKDGVGVLDFEEPTPASAVLLGWRGKESTAVEDDNDFLVALRNVAADKERRDILAALSSTEVLQPHERTLLHRYALELGDEVFEATKTLERLWGTCNELMTSSEARLKDAVDDASSLMNISSTSSSIGTNLLLLEWLKQSIATATIQRDAAAQALVNLAREKSDDIGKRVESYFSAGDYRAGVALFHGGVVPKAAADRVAVRRTMWRDEALKAWPEPRTKLANDLRGSTQQQNDLVAAWTSATPASDKFIRWFYDVISGEAGRSLNENQKRFPVKLADLREHKDRRTLINCATIRRYFQVSRLNPTFLPQLAVFKQIVLTSSPHQASRSGSVLDDWCKAANTETPGSLVVFLAPDMPLVRRDELCSGLRKRGIDAAIVDDSDMCRLCAASVLSDGHDFIPFLEIVLEQLDLDRASPFSSLDGQHVRMETYIGRTNEAEQIALRGTYTRIFSGRKLGKSALLKYVAETYDLYQLPSGNTLNVFFITISGGDSEQWVVKNIVAEMVDRFTLPEKPTPSEQPPAERFSAYMKRFLQEKPSQSILLILDEADAFVEGQLARYDLDREGSLSFRLMKELPAQVDANQLPRIRTIFSGYRVTNTRGGVWANAGDVLVLRPLAEEEAVNFLQGMLARVGISLGNHAPFVAMRCGFQPAVLIRFGESIMKRLKRGSKSGGRETLRVTHDEVSATLNEQAVLDEIKTVVNNNFQGNRMGAIVFGATLLALKDLEPGLALTQGPGQVLAKLRDIEPNVDWLERIDASPLAEIERNLQDFIDRELLDVLEAPRFGIRQYRLRFPHFLPVLTQQSEVALEVRQQIQAIRATASLRRLSECVLSESALDTVRYWYRQDNVTDCKLVVVGGHWTEALLNKKCGVSDRLGYERAAFCGSTMPDAVSTLIAKGTRVFENVAASDWPEFLAAQAVKPVVLVGGMALQRIARRYALDGGDVPVEVVTLGRLTGATLAWWFEDARALHFKASDAVAQIDRATGSIPFLVAAFDRLLPHVDESEVSHDDLKKALALFDTQLSELAGRLSDATWEGCLTPREIELLKMAVRVAEEINEFSLEKEFPEYWALLGQQSFGGPPLSDPGDWSSLKLLAEAGLLPVKVSGEATVNTQSLGSVTFDTAGALVRLIKALGQASAG